ncbi:hypothetical protein ACIBI7_50395 [Nonomuraea fuscirosea]|uniref:hypothetical protein n=1 Tax=Nonomuraea fuscirosea TaxID=1291556 RepID=UPI0037AE0AF9
MFPMQIAAIAVPLTIRMATLVFAHLARQNERRNAAERATYPRVCVGTDANGTPVNVTAPADFIGEIQRRLGNS